jgi:hypothetical protein
LRANNRRSTEIEVGCSSVTVRRLTSATDACDEHAHTHTHTHGWPHVIVTRCVLDGSIQVYILNVVNRLGECRCFNENSSCTRKV